jgi:hypothetical protein
MSSTSYAGDGAGAGAREVQVSPMPPAFGPEEEASTLVTPDLAGLTVLVTLDAPDLSYPCLATISTALSSHFSYIIACHCLSLLILHSELV